MSGVRNIPRLRFPEFEENWKTVRFKDVLLNNRLGGNYSNSEEITGFPLIKMGNIDRGRIKLNKLNYVTDIENLNPEDLVNEGDLFFNTRNTLELVGKVAIWRNELPVAYYNSNLMKIDFEENRFMNYRLNSFSGIKKLRRIATGTTSVAAIYTKDLLKISLNIPSLPEQQKIADFLTAVDKRIELLEKKKTLLETYKKGVMKKIFNQAIRFKDDNGNDFPDWEEMRLGSLLKHVSIRNKSLNVELVLSVSNTLGFISQKEQFDKHRVASKDVSNYKIVCKNQFGYNPSRINVGSIALLKDYEIGIVSPMYVIFQTKERLDSIYMEYLTQTHLFRHYVKVGCSGSVRDSLNFDEMEKFKFNIPSLNEQIKISEFLISLDNQLELIETQIDKSKTWKKGLLQKMFV